MQLQWPNFSLSQELAALDALAFGPATATAACGSIFQTQGRGVVLESVRAARTASCFMVRSDSSTTPLEFGHNMRGAAH